MMVRGGGCTVRGGGANGEIWSASRGSTTPQPPPDSPRPSFRLSLSGSLHGSLSLALSLPLSGSPSPPLWLTLSGSGYRTHLLDPNHTSLICIIFTHQRASTDSYYFFITFLYKIIFLLLVYFGAFLSYDLSVMSFVPAQLFLAQRSYQQLVRHVVIKADDGHMQPFKKGPINQPALAQQQPAGLGNRSPPMGELGTQVVLPFI